MAPDARAGGWIEDLVYDAALDAHRAAIAKRKAWESGGRVNEALHRDALVSYVRARRLYELYIATYPKSYLVYEARYQIGEVLYFSGRVVDSVPYYRWVRDHRDRRTSVDRTLEAARSIISAYESLCPVTARNLDELLASPRPITPLAMPRCHAQLMATYAEYARIMPDAPDASAIAYNAVLVALTYLHVDEAVAQLRDIVERFPSHSWAKHVLELVERWH
jgi:TolA-binding protein